MKLSPESKKQRAKYRALERKVKSYNRQHMIETLHMAYKWALQQTSGTEYLNSAQQRELGRRLAAYQLYAAPKT